MAPKRLSKRVYVEASFTEASTVTGSLPVAAKVQLCTFRDLQIRKPPRSLHEDCKLNPPRLGHVRIEEYDREVDSHRL